MKNTFTFENKLVDLIELETKKCPQKKGECYLNEILTLVQKEIEKAKNKNEK